MVDRPVAASLPRLSCSIILKDRLVRIALRRGQGEGTSDEHIVRALTLFYQKRHVSLATGENGERELAWLLYAAAWGRPTRANNYAKEVQSALADLETVSRDIGSGNDTRLYLLRALALRAGGARIGRRPNWPTLTWAHLRTVASPRIPVR